MTGKSSNSKAVQTSASWDRIWEGFPEPSLASASLEMSMTGVETNISTISKKIDKNLSTETVKKISERTRAFVRDVLGPAIMAGALWILGISSAHAAEWVKMKTTAECIDEVTSEYDEKIKKAEADGKDKAVAVFKRRKWEFLEGCKAYDTIAGAEQRIAAGKAEIAAGKAEIAEYDRRIAAGEQRIAAYEKILPIAKQVSERWSATPSEMKILIDGYRTIQAGPESELKPGILKNLRYVIERLGGTV